MTLCACADSDVIRVPPVGHEDKKGFCFRCLCRLRPWRPERPPPSPDKNTLVVEVKYKDFPPDLWDLTSGR